MIRRNYAKSFDGFKNRILSKIMALNVIQFINKLNNRNINNLKISIALINAIRIIFSNLLFIFKLNTVVKTDKYGRFQRRF